MSREIKFEMWDSEQNEMLTWKRINQLDTEGICMFLDMLTEERFKKRQYTGLTDRNGKEIYEGDVIHIPAWKMNGEVNFASGMFKVRDRAREDFNQSLASFMVEIRCEVIGNIYEHPHLLDQGLPQAIARQHMPSEAAAARGLLSGDQ